MSMNYMLADAVTRIRNGQRASHSVVRTGSSRMVKGVMDVLKEEGYIRDWRIVGDEKKPELEVELKYFEGKPVINEIKLVSRPGRRVSSQIAKLPKFHNGLGVSILTTSKGVMSDHKARQENVGGEVLCNVF